MYNIVELGHYQKNDTIGGEDAVIIRVISEHPTKDEFFLTEDGKEIHETDIVNNYTKITWEHEKKKLNNQKPVDIGDIEQQAKDIIVTEQKEPQPSKKMTMEERQLDLFGDKDNNVHNIPVQKQDNKQNEIRQKSLEQMIIDKFNTNNTGEPQYLTITLKIPVNYKLKEIVDAAKILDLDTDKISRMLAHDITDYDTIKELTVKEISRMFELKFEDINPKPSTQIFVRNDYVDANIKEPAKPISDLFPIENKQIISSEQDNSAENFFIDVIDDGITKIDEIIKKHAKDV